LDSYNKFPRAISELVQISPLILLIGNPMTSRMNHRIILFLVGKRRTVPNPNCLIEDVNFDLNMYFRIETPKDNITINF
jgi:hypothetical protein